GTAGQHPGPATADPRGAAPRPRRALAPFVVVVTPPTFFCGRCHNDHNHFRGAVRAAWAGWCGPAWAGRCGPAWAGRVRGRPGLDDAARPGPDGAADQRPRLPW